VDHDFAPAAVPNDLAGALNRIRLGVGVGGRSLSMGRDDVPAAGAVRDDVTLVSGHGAPFDSGSSRCIVKGASDGTIKGAVYGVFSGSTGPVDTVLASTDLSGGRTHAFARTP
jgi:hypothetical protein